jgi:sulfite reductase (NADPH) hemoprotein beta-component
VSSEKPPSAVEQIKRASRFLRGTLEESLADAATGAVPESDRQLTKFHGIYQQDDRDVRAARAEQMLEPAYGFMIRIRIPGGVLAPEQWLAVDDIAQRYGGGSIRLTTRQAIQLHGVEKRRLKAVMRAIGEAGLTTIAACGDVNRNVVVTPLPEQSALHRVVYAQALEVVERLTPRTGAYSEIWHGAPKQEAADEEPLYGPVYLPRKFKVGFVVPPLNDIDVFAQDLGFIAIARGGSVVGYNVAVGGGLGMTHGDPRTYPRLAETVGFCEPEQVVAVAERLVGVQRDFGDRSDRAHARFKYTIDDRGIEWLRAELERRLGFTLSPAKPVKLTHTGDRLGWVRGEDGRMHLTLLIPSGRVVDTQAQRLRSGIHALARKHHGELRVTANQNLIVTGVAPDDAEAIDGILAEHGLDLPARINPLRRNAMSCVALPTCGLAMAESERYLPELLAKLELILRKHGLEEEDLLVRVTGCPNGCARPYLAEIALVGKAPGRYNLFLGGGLTGERLNELYRQNLPESEILATLEGLFAEFAQRRNAGEAFGDFLHRTGVVGRRTDPSRFSVPSSETALR